MEYVEVLKDVEVLKYQLAGLFDTLQQAENTKNDIDNTMNKLKDGIHYFHWLLFTIFTAFLPWIWEKNRRSQFSYRKSQKRQKTNDYSQKIKD